MAPCKMIKENARKMQEECMIRLEKAAKSYTNPLSYDLSYTLSFTRNPL